MYITLVNISGSWSQHTSQHDNILQYRAGAHNAGVATKWMPFGPVDLKVAWGRSHVGTIYLNVFVRHLGKVGVDIGGVLGLDDHSAAATVSDKCRFRLELLNLPIENDEQEPHRE